MSADKTTPAPEPEWPEWCSTPQKRQEWADDCMKWRGRILTGPYAHWCFDWDFLPVDASTPEIECCTCWSNAHG